MPYNMMVILYTRSLSSELYGDRICLATTLAEYKLDCSKLGCNVVI